MQKINQKAPLIILLVLMATIYMPQPAQACNHFGGSCATQADCCDVAYVYANILGLNIYYHYHGGPGVCDTTAGECVPCVPLYRKCTRDAECCGNFNAIGTTNYPCPTKGTAAGCCPPDCCTASECSGTLCVAGYCGCVPQGGSCTSSNQCCDPGFCNAGSCVCFSNGQACTNSDQCCNGVCINKACCVGPNARCNTNLDCCGTDVCSGSPRLCTHCSSYGASCSSNDDCCNPNNPNTCRPYNVTFSDYTLSNGTYSFTFHTDDINSVLPFFRGYYVINVANSVVVTNYHCTCTAVGATCTTYAECCSGAGCTVVGFDPTHGVLVGACAGCHRIISSLWLLCCCCLWCCIIYGKK